MSRKQSVEGLSVSLSISYSALPTPVALHGLDFTTDPIPIALRAFSEGDTWEQYERQCDKKHFRHGILHHAGSRPAITYYM
jgi:hypothetical protein